MTKSLLALALTAVAAFTTPNVAQAALDCIVPTREEGFEPHRPGAAALQRAARAVAAITQRNAMFMEGNKPIRVRTTINYYGERSLAASVITTAYNQTAWLAGGCKVSKFADRGRSLADGSIAIFLNDPDAMLGGRIGDAELVASIAPLRQGSVAGFPVYAVAHDERNPRALLSANGYEPWVAVTEAERIAWRERDVARAAADYAASQQETNNTLDEAKIEAMYRDLKKFDAAGAEKMRADLLKALAQARRDQPQNDANAKRALEARRTAFDENRRPLAKADPNWNRRDPNRIHFIAVSLSPQPKTDPEYAWQQASYAALDYAALAELVTR